MELIIREKPNRLKCSGCPNTTDNTKIVSMDEYDCRAGYYCAECLIKAVLMVRPISFPKNIISPLSLITHEEYKRLIDLNRPTIARQVLQNYDAFIEWLSPFLESK